MVCWISIVVLVMAAVMVTTTAHAALTAAGAGNNAEPPWSDTRPDATPVPITVQLMPRSRTGGNDPHRPVFADRGSPSRLITVPPGVGTGNIANSSWPPRWIVLLKWNAEKTDSCLVLSTFDNATYRELQKDNPVRMNLEMCGGVDLFGDGVYRWFDNAYWGVAPSAWTASEKAMMAGKPARPPDPIRWEWQTVVILRRCLFEPWQPQPDYASQTASQIRVAMGSRVTLTTTNQTGQVVTLKIRDDASDDNNMNGRSINFFFFNGTLQENYQLRPNGPWRNVYGEYPFMSRWHGDRYMVVPPEHWTPTELSLATGNGVRTEWVPCPEEPLQVVDL